jgi:hypothetical protein
MGVSTRRQISSRTYIICQERARGSSSLLRIGNRPHDDRQGHLVRTHHRAIYMVVIRNCGMDELFFSWPCVPRTIQRLSGGSLKWSVEARPIRMETSYHARRSWVILNPRHASSSGRLKLPGESKCQRNVTKSSFVCLVLLYREKRGDIMCDHLE